VWLYNQKQDVTYQFEEAQKKWMKQREDLVKILQETKEKLSKSDEELVGLQDKLQQTYDRLNNFRKEFDGLSEKVEKKDTKIVSLQKELKDKEIIISKLKKENENYSKRIKEFNTENSFSESTNEYKFSGEFGERLSTWGNEKDVLKEKLLLLSNELKKTDIERQDIINQIEEVNKLLEERILKISNFMKGLEKLMKESKKLALEKAFNSVSAVELPPIVIHKKQNNTIDSKDEKSYSDEGELFFTSFNTNKEKLNSSLNYTEDESRGRILIVNLAENFVVINLGSKDGVRKGMVFEIYRGAGEVGKVKVIEVREKLCAANIEKVMYDGIITANDYVKLME